MASVEKILQNMKASRSNIRFEDALKVCEHYFGKPRIRGSHYSFKASWQGVPWINIQNKSGKIAFYQVKQILDAIKKLEGEK